MNGRFARNRLSNWDFELVLFIQSSEPQRHVTKSQVVFITSATLSVIYCKAGH